MGSKSLGEADKGFPLLTANGSHAVNVLWNITLICIVLIYAVGHLFNDAKIVAFFYIVLG